MAQLAPSETTSCDSRGAIQSLFHEDLRGFLFSAKAIEFEAKEILLSHSHQNVFRGFHMSPYRKQVFVVTGKIVDFWYGAVAWSVGFPCAHCARMRRVVAHGAESGGGVTASGRGDCQTAYFVLCCVFALGASFVLFFSFMSCLGGFAFPASTNTGTNRTLAECLKTWSTPRPA